MLPDDLVKAGRLSRDWAEQLLPGGERDWPRTVLLHPPAMESSEAGLQALRAWRDDVYQVAERYGLDVEVQNRRIGGIVYRLPNRLSVPTLEHAAHVAGDERPVRIATARHRLAVIGPVDSAAALRSIVQLSDLDFELLQRVLAWLREHDETGLTPRQLQIEGVHGKWIESHRGLVEELLGRPLRTVGRTKSVEMTWLDPEHRAAGRWHDSFTVGDAGMRAPYELRLAVICENKDTAVHFPPLPAAVAIQGNGTHLPRLADLPWLDGVPLVYWGDIDAAGYAIVHQLRSQGREVPTILMDAAAAEHYSYLGVRHHPNGTLITANRRQLPRLTPGERVVYDQVTTPGRDSWLRIEQERMPFEHALQALRALRD